MIAGPREHWSARALFIGLLVYAASLLGCAKQPAPCIVLVTLDTTRVDLLGVYGGRGRTPRLDAFAADSLRFDRAYTTAPYTGPSHASLLTGQNPPRHGLRDYLEQALPDDALTLAEHLAAVGWSTGAFVSTYVLDPRFGVDQGFELYDSPDRDGGDRHWRAGPATTDRALAWLQARAPTEPFLLWVHWYDAHGPYMPPRELRDPLPEGVAPGSPDAQRQRYYEQARVLDAQFGRLEDALAAAGRTPIWVVVSDHGELLGHHGRKLGAHSNALVDATIHIPLLLRAPGLEPGVREDVTSVIDVMPTLLARLGLEPPPGLEGRDLLAPATSEPALAYSETFYPYFGRSPEGDEHRSLRDERFTLVHTETGVRLFDRESDPAERTDVGERHPERRAALERALADRLARWGVSPRAPLELAPEELDEHRERLRALGYIE